MKGDVQMLHQNDGVISQVSHIEYSRDVIHSYSGGIKKIFDLALSYVYYAEEQHKKGANAVWFQAKAEAPLILACDAIPVAFTEAGRLGSPNALTVASDVYQIPEDICSMVRVNIGEWYLRKNKIKRILGLGSACEAYNIMFEVMKKEGYDVYTIDTAYRAPDMDHDRYESMLKFYEEEVRQAARWINGKELDEDKFRYEIERRNRINRKLRKICDLRKLHPTYLKSLPAMYMISATGHFFGRPEEYEEALDMIISEFEALKADEYNEKTVPLAWSGGRGQEFGIFEAIDEAGGAVIDWHLPTPYEYDYPDWEKDPVRSYSQYLLGKDTGGNTIDKLDLLGESIKASGAKGVLLYGYVGCTFSGIDRELQRQYYRRHDIPCLSLDGSFQVGMPSGQLITRVKAFVEMLS